MIGIFIMTCPITFINDFINDYVKSNEIIEVENFRIKLYENYSIMSKYYEEDNLLIVFHKYNTPLNNEFAQECRSLIIDMITLKVISYTCPNPIINKEAQQFLLNNNELDLDIYKCYEGSIMSLFNHNDKWYLSTRRCLDSKNSIWNNSNYYDMFMDVLNKENISFDNFVDKLNKDNGYYFILIHYNNKNIIDYSKYFGENYSKLCLIFVRNKSDQYEITNYDFDNYNHIFKPDKMSIEDFSKENEKLSINIECEGIIIKTVKNNKNYLFKLQTNSYQFCHAIGPDSNIFKGYLFLYQNGDLKKYIENNKEHKKLEKIINPHNILESYDTIGIVDSVFKVLTSELFELYKLLGKLKNGSHQNVELYNILPKEFKDVLYSLRGIFFKNKIDKNKTDKNIFGIKDIYQYLKNINIEQLCALLRQRKLMHNWVIINKNNNELNLFKTISNHCDKVNLKLIAIFINKVFPDILLTDIPLLKKNNKNITNDIITDDNNIVINNNIIIVDDTNILTDYDIIIANDIN